MSPKQVVGFTCVFNSEVDQLISLAWLLLPVRCFSYPFVFVPFRNPKRSLNSAAATAVSAAEMTVSAAETTISAAETTVAAAETPVLAAETTVFRPLKRPFS